MTARVDRRSVLAGIGVLLGGCANPRGILIGGGFFPLANPAPASAYGPILDHGHEIPGLDLTRIDPSSASPTGRLRRPYRPGTIVVNIAERKLYLLRARRRAIRYAVGVGREEALNFRGSAVIGRKAEWPTWSPTADMIRRMPIYAHYADGLSGGIGNPLGARAFILYRGNQDTYFRLHGTNEPDTIGDQGVQRMHTPVQSRHRRSLQPSSGWNAGRRAAGGGGAGSGPVNPSVDANAIFVSLATTPRRADRSSLYQDASSPSQSSRAQAPACVQA